MFALVLSSASALVSSSSISSVDRSSSKFLLYIAILSARMSRMFPSCAYISLSISWASFSNLSHLSSSSVSSSIGLSLSSIGVESFFYSISLRKSCKCPVGLCPAYYQSGTMGVCLRGVRRPGRPKCKLTVEDATLSFWGVRTPTGDPGAISGCPALVFCAVRTPQAPWVPRASFATVWHLGPCR